LIELKLESPEELRKRLRDMSNLELRRFGERLLSTVADVDEVTVGISHVATPFPAVIV
jgi:hypothetical protein